MIDARQLRMDIIRPTLERLDLWSQTAENLLMGTAAQESRLGTYVRQLGNGPALGIFQMEPNTFNDIYANFLKYRAELADKVNSLRAAQPQPDSEQVMVNMAYAAAMARVHYLRVPAALPADPNDVEALGQYWKQYYNTPEGKGTVAEFVENYHRYVTA